MVTVTDAAPAPSPYCYVDPCVVPIRPDVPMLPCWEVKRLSNCRTCEPITTPYVTADSLHHAVQLALSYQHKYDSTSTDALALQMLKAILTHPLVDTTAEEAQILDRAYRAMQAIYASSLDDSVRAQAFANRAAMNQVIDQKLSAAVPDSGVVNPVFYLLMDRALASQAIGDLASARASLVEASANTNPLTQGYYDYWDCTLAATQDLRDSVITDYEYFDRLLTCHQPRTASRGQQAQSVEDYLSEQRAKAAARVAKIATRNSLQLLPNPASRTVTVTLTAAPAGPVAVELTSLTGQKVRHWQRAAAISGPAAWPLDLTGVAPGVYLLRVSTTERTDTRRLVVQP